MDSAVAQVVDGARALSDFIAKPRGRVSQTVLGTFDEVARTVEVSFASEEELVDRGSFFERLMHDKDSIRARRLENGLAVCVNHSTDDQVGVVDGWSLGTDRRSRAVCRFGASERAEDIFRDVRTGIRQLVSVLYIIHKARLADFEHEGKPVVLIDEWEPLEISFVPVPADPSVGVGRSIDTEDAGGGTAPAEQPKEGKKMDDNTTTATAPSVDMNKVTADAQRSAEQRVKEIVAIGQRHGMADFAMEHVGRGSSVDEFRMAVLEKLGNVTKVTGTPNIGMSERDVKQFSTARLVRALANPNARDLQTAAGFEFECSAEAKRLSGRSNENIVLPYDVLVAKRDLVVGTANAGGYLKGTDHMGDSFIDVLRNKMMCVQMGATEMMGLQGDVAIPALTAGGTGYWVDESTAPTESTQTLGQVPLAPKVCGTYTEISKKLLAQSSPSVDQLVENDLALAIALAVDKAVLHGGGTNEPTGLATLCTAPTAAQGGATGAATTYAKLVHLEAALAANNVDAATVAFMTNPKVRGLLRRIFPNTTGGDIPVYTDGADGFGRVLGYRVGVTNQVKSDLEKSTSGTVLSAIFFGDWSQVIVGMWGNGIELIVDPYSLSTKGWVRVTALALADSYIRNTGAIVTILDVSTT
jgi:HK97 family phage major capsid protein